MQSSLSSRFFYLPLGAIGRLTIALLASLACAEAHGLVEPIGAERAASKAGIDGESVAQTEVAVVLVLSVVAITVFRRRVRQ